MVRSVFTILDWIQYGCYCQKDIDYARGWLTESKRDGKLPKEVLDYYFDLLLRAEEKLYNGDNGNG